MATSIEQDSPEKLSKAVLLRLSPSVYDRCAGIAEKANKPLAAILRLLIEGALKEGVEVTPYNSNHAN